MEKSHPQDTSQFDSFQDFARKLIAVPKQEFDKKMKEEESKPKVYVSGEVLRPGPYFVRPTINVMQALSLAGGLGPFAAKQRIQLHRKINGVDSIFIFDYNAYLAGTNTADNINLRSGDIIVVPERGLFE